MSPEFEQVEVRTGQRVVPRAARLKDGRVFVPDCEIEEGDEVEVGGTPCRVTRCKPHELEHRAGTVDERSGCLLTLEATEE